VVSDAVNTAARMEGLTKFYGAAITISKDTLSHLTDPLRYSHRFLGQVQVKGKKEAVAVFEILDGDSERMKTLKTRTKGDFEAGLSHYFAKEFEMAAPYFRKVLNANPEDKAAKLYLERSAKFMVQGVPEDWEGVEAMESK